MFVLVCLSISSFIGEAKLEFIDDQNFPLDQLEGIIVVALNDGMANVWDDPGDALKLSCHW